MFYPALFRTFDEIFDSGRLAIPAGRTVKDSTDLTYEFAVPGTKKEDITIEIEDGELYVDWKCRGMSYSETIRLSRDIEKATAKLADGILTIVVSPMKRNVVKVQVE